MHYTVFQYPLVIRQVDVWMVFSLPDLKISIVDDGPHKNFGPKYIAKLAKNLAKLYIKGDRRLKELAQLGKRFPTPSYIKNSTTVQKNETLTVSEVAEIMNCSADTVRRKADSGEIPAFYVGSHRRFYRHLIENSN